VNDRLSLQRASIVGSGTDDVRDALGRRVEFKITSCA
jgi:hypothetical protein